MGFFFGIKSIIGPGCVVHVETFLNELEELENAGIPAKKLVHVASNTHLITDFHRAQDNKDTEIGTTKRGNGPAYRDKYARKGVRAIEDPRLEPYIISMYHELYENVEYDGIQGAITADNVKIDLITKKIEIYMDNANSNVEVTTK